MEERLKQIKDSWNLCLTSIPFNALLRESHGKNRSSESHMKKLCPTATGIYGKGIRKNAAAHIPYSAPVKMESAAKGVLSFRHPESIP